MNKKVLLFAPYFPPRRRVGSTRPFRFATHLERLGWKPAIISIRDNRSSLTEREQKVLEGIDMLNIGSPIDNTSPSNTEKGKAKKQSSLATFIDNRFPIDTWLPLFIQKRKEIDDFVSFHKPDLIWSTGDPWSGNHVARQIARKFQVPWVADFRDPWTLCSVRYGKRGWPATSFDKKAELAIMKEADHVTFTAKSTEQKYCEHYPVLENKTSTIYNSFDKQFYSQEGDNPGLDNGYLNVLFLGKFRELSTATSIINVLVEIEKHSPELLKRLRIYSFDTLIDNDLRRVEEYGFKDIFNTLQRVPNEQVITLCNYFDLLLLSTHPGRDDIVPAKLHEYLITDRPVFSLAPNPEVGEIIAKTGKGVHFEQVQLSKAASMLETCISAKISSSELPVSTRGINEKEIDAFEVSRNTEKLANIFNTLVADE